MAWISFGALPCKKKKLDDSSRLDVVEIASVPNVLSSLFRSCSDLSAARWCHPTKDDENGAEYGNHSGEEKRTQ